jgi:glycine betaine catabolism A
MTTFVKPTVGGGARTLEGRWYTSAAIFSAEREQIFAREWICAGHADGVRAPGEYRLIEIAGESLILVRDEAQRLHAFYNVCRHRGSRVCEERRGRLAGSIQCPYHAWTYGLDGTLKVARNMADVPAFDRSEYSLREAAVAIWEGFVFVNLAECPEPFERAFAPLIGRFQRWNIGALRPVRSITYELRCNWKLVFQNYSECYHCAPVHPQLERLSPSDSGRNDLVEGAFLGGFSTFREHCSSMTLSGRTTRPPLPDIADEDRDRAYYYTLFPSMLLSLHPDYVMVHEVQPNAVDRTTVICSWLFDPAIAARDDFDPSDAVEFWDLTNRQDWHVNELTQLGVSSRAYTPGPYANAEGLLAAFDRHYLGRISGTVLSS